MTSINSLLLTSFSFECSFSFLKAGDIMNHLGQTLRYTKRLFISNYNAFSAFFLDHYNTGVSSFAKKFSRLCFFCFL
jgi:hypothetical protein